MSPRNEGASPYHDSTDLGRTVRYLHTAYCINCRLQAFRSAVTHVGHPLSEICQCSDGVGTTWNNISNSWDSWFSFELSTRKVLRLLTITGKQRKANNELLWPAELRTGYLRIES